MDSRERTFLDLYDSSADALLRHCYFKTHNRELAKDLVQEAFMRTWRSLAEGKEIANLSAYLYHVANNLIIDHYRKKKELSLDELAESGFDPQGQGKADVVFSAEAREALAAIEQLPEPARETMLLRYATGLSVGEIAVMRGESDNVVSVRIHRALEKVREILHHETH